MSSSIDGDIDEKMREIFRITVHGNHGIMRAIPHLTIEATKDDDCWKMCSRIRIGTNHTAYKCNKEEDIQPRIQKLGLDFAKNTVHYHLMREMLECKAALTRLSDSVELLHAKIDTTPGGEGWLAAREHWNANNNNNKRPREQQQDDDDDDDEAAAKKKRVCEKIND